jgi:hypothetical protein
MIAFQVWLATSCNYQAGSAPDSKGFDKSKSANANSHSMHYLEKGILHDIQAPRN